MAFAYTIALTTFGLVPKIPVDNTFVPPIHDYAELLNWGFSFGVVPAFSAIGAFILSRVFDIHNVLSKLLQIRFAWEKYFIVKPLRARARSDVPLNRQTVRQVMNDFYYDAVKGIDQHYVELFWRYALPFWILFEHALLVAVSIIVLALLKVPHLFYLVLYLFGVVGACAVQFFMVTSRKSVDQVRQIPTEKIESFFKKLRVIVKA